MRKKLRHILPLAFVLTLLFVFSFVFATISSARSSNDYSRPGYSAEIYNETFDSVKFLRDKLGVSIGNVESEYISEASDFYFSYPKNIPSSYVELNLKGNQVFVYASPYTYTNSEEVTATWMPLKVTCGDSTKALKLGSNGKYEADFTFDAVIEGLTFNVEYYTADIVVPKEDVNRELSRAYYDAKYLEYLENVLAYEAALEIYNEYLSEKKIYDELYAEYTEYLDDLEEYAAELAKYEQYLADLKKYEADYVIYLESLKLAEELKEEREAYNEYVLKMEKINHRLSLVEDMKVKQTKLKRSLFSAITGDAVDQVLAEEDVLTSNVIGADKEVVRGAGDATEAIRAFYDAYFALEDDASKYRYYQINYKTLKDNVVKLFQCLENLYENGYVKGIIDSKDRSEKYEILLAQLYFAANALSDEVVYNYSGTVAFDGKYKINGINGYKSPADILGDVSNYFVDKNIATPPANEAYPDPVPNPNYTPVPEPQKPEKVSMPTLPAEVTEPEEPTPKEKPEEPLKVENPNGISAKAPFDSSSVEAKLLDAYRKGFITQRNDAYLKEDFNENKYISVAKVYGAKIITLTYHDYNGNPIGDVEFEKGDFPEIKELPEKPATPEFSYVFNTWVDKLGTGAKTVDFSKLESDARIYPSYKQVVNKYTVNWQIGDKVISEVLPYGTMPICPETPEKAWDYDKEYVFSGWSPEVSAVESDITYTAVFDAISVIPELSDGSITKSADSELSVNSASLLGEKIYVSRLFELAAGKYSVKFVFSEPAVSRSSADIIAEFSISYAELISMKKASVAYLEFSVSKEENSENYFAIAYDKNGIQLNSLFKISASVTTEKNHENMRVLYYDGSKKMYVKSTYSDGKISFNLNTGCHYSYVLEVFPSDISVIEQEVNVFVDKTSALPGEVVAVSVDLPQGYELISVYYVYKLNSDSIRVEVEDGKFTMPDFDVSVGVQVRKIVYTVTFVSDGMVVSSKQYYYGDTVEVPDGVSKADDENYSYTFKRWTPGVTSVTADASYTAVYEKTPIIKEDDGGLKISAGTLRIIVTVGIVAVVSLGAVLPSFVLSLILLIRRKKRGTTYVSKPKKH